MTSERERKNREELFRLMAENPDLPVAAMVDSEIVAEAFGEFRKMMKELCGAEGC